MVKYQERLDEVFGALSDPTRRAILQRLARGETTVNELAEPFDTSLPAISKHLRVLESAGLIRRRTVGRHRVCTISTATMDGAANWIEQTKQFWNEQLDSLAEYLKREMENENEPRIND